MWGGGGRVWGGEEEEEERGLCELWTEDVRSEEGGGRMWEGEEERGCENGGRKRAGMGGRGRCMEGEKEEEDAWRGEEEGTQLQ